MSNVLFSKPLGALALVAALAVAMPQGARALFLKNSLDKAKAKTEELAGKAKKKVEEVVDKGKELVAKAKDPLETGWNAVRTFLDPSGYLVSCYKGAVGSKHKLTGPCNGGEKLCSRPYNEVVQALTHNSMAALTYVWAPGFANHCSPMLRQLEDGIRGFMLDLHMDGGKPALCHEKCGAGKLDLVRGLKEFTGWLGTHKDQVVTFNLESYIDGSVFQKALKDAGLEGYVYVHPGAKKAWPTMGELVKSGKRLVIFTSKDGGAFPGYHSVSDYTSENDYAWKRESDFGCKVRHSNKGAPYTLNHFLTNPVGAPHLAATANTKKSVVAHAKKCQKEQGAMPTFIAVDWYELGEVLPAVKELNGL